MTQLALPVSRKLQWNTACKCVKRDQPATSRIIWPPAKRHNHKISHGHPCRSNIHSHQIWRHQPLQVGIHRSLKKNDRKCHLWRFMTNISAAAFCLPHQLVGFLLVLNLIYTDMFAPWPQKWGSFGPTVVYALRKWQIFIFSESTDASSFEI